MTFQATSQFIRKLNKITHKNSLLSQQINRKLVVLKQSPDHPNLRLHKLTGRKQEWSISIKSDLRIIFQYTPTGILFTDIGSHDEVY